MTWRMVGLSNVASAAILIAFGIANRKNLPGPSTVLMVGGVFCLVVGAINIVRGIIRGDWA